MIKCTAIHLTVFVLFSAGITPTRAQAETSTNPIGPTGVQGMENTTGCSGVSGAAVQCVASFVPTCMGNFNASQAISFLCNQLTTQAQFQNFVTACIPAISTLNSIVQCGIALPANFLAWGVQYLYDHSNPGTYQTASGETVTAGGIGPANQSAECYVNGQAGHYQTSVLGTTCVVDSSSGPTDPTGTCAYACSGAANGAGPAAGNYSISNVTEKNCLGSICAGATSACGMGTITCQGWTAN